MNLLHIYPLALRQIYMAYSNKQPLAEIYYLM